MQGNFERWKIRFLREFRLKVISRKRLLQRWIRAPFGGKPAFFIGPTNSANQATAWSRALQGIGSDSESLRISAQSVGEWFSTDYALTRKEWLEFSTRQKLADRVASTKDIVLFESLRPIFRLLDARDERNQILEDFDLMEDIGKRIGVIFHGSDIRDTQSHAARNSYSPFHKQSPELVKLQERVFENSKLLPEIRRRKIPIFVTTQDLLLDVPDAHWLPVTIDFELFNQVALSSPIFSDPNEKLRVLFLPSRSWLKSAELIEPILLRLRDEGLIDYQSYLSEGRSLNHSEIPDAMARVDLVIDQFLGVIGVFPIEALAAGRLVMSYVPVEAGEVPIISVTPATLESEIRRVAQDRPQPIGIDYARNWHDGRESLLALAEVFAFKA
jgi:hypothetical protein